MGLPNGVITAMLYSYFMLQLNILGDEVLALTIAGLPGITQMPDWTELGDIILFLLYQTFL